TEFEGYTNRKRVLFFATNHKPMMDSGWGLFKFRNGRGRTFHEAVRGLETTTCLPLRPLQAKFLPHIPEGGCWKHLPPEMQEEAIGGALHSGGGKTGYYRRIWRHRTVPTLLTNPTMKATFLGHPEEDRCLSIEEYRR